MNWIQLHSVRLELTWPLEPKALWYAVVGMLCLLLLGLLGATITQTQPEGVLLNRRQWQILQAQHQARQDVARMTRDLSQLARARSSSQPDPVETVWLAQRLYSRHQTGPVSTAAARQALIVAGQVAVQVASGAMPPENLEVALQTAEELLGLLQKP